MANPEKFLKKYSGKIIGVGDTFDFFRSSNPEETFEEYLDRTYKYWIHINTFIAGNHDAVLLERMHNDHKYILPWTRIYRNGPVLALHGHQLKFSFDQAQIMKYENMRYEARWFWDIEEWCCKTFYSFFTLHGKKAYAQDLSTLQEVDNMGLLDDKVETVITGHTHLPFNVKLMYKGKRYRVANCGSSLHGKVFKPIYVRKIDKWFVSDLHLGTAKSELN